jgi:hypothetical protein
LEPKLWNKGNLTHLVEKLKSGVMAQKYFPRVKEGSQRCGNGSGLCLQCSSPVLINVTNIWHFIQWLASDAWKERTQIEAG